MCIVAGDVELTKKIISIAQWITLEIIGNSLRGMRPINTQTTYDNDKQVKKIIVNKQGM